MKDPVTAPPAPDARARGAVRPAPLAAWWAGPAAVEIGLFSAYSARDAQFHWFTHFFVGAGAALLGMTVKAALSGSAVRLPLVWVLAGHLLAMAPDLLFVAGEPHWPWMDVFLGHVSSHYVPGREVTWYVVFLFCLATYLAVVDRIRRTRRSPDAPRSTT